MALIGVNGNVAGGAATSPQSFCRVDGVPVLTNVSTVASHGDPPHATATLTKAGYFFRINNQSVLVNGNLATCGDALVATGFVNVG